jgi:hypothetical protein
MNIKILIVVCFSPVRVLPTQCLGIKLEHPVPEGYKYGHVVLQVG